MNDIRSDVGLMENDTFRIIEHAEVTGKDGRQIFVFLFANDSDSIFLLSASARDNMPSTVKPRKFTSEDEARTAFNSLIVQLKS